MRFFDGFELGPMHRSDKGPKFGAPLFGVSSPFGDAGCGIQDLEGEGFAPPWTPNNFFHSV